MNAQSNANAEGASAIEQSLIADIPRLTADEQSALRFVLDRIIVQGRASYAPWQAGLDMRDMEKEIGDELADAIVYTGMRAVMRAVAKRRRIEAFRHDEAFRAVDEAMKPLVEVES
jgi:NTP pyrophosphatase (non-canonical NTP hydrolase)